MQPSMLANYLSIGSLDFAGGCSRGAHFMPRIVFNETRIISIRHKTYLLALGLPGGFEPHAASDFTHFWLCQIAKREDCSFQLLLRHLEQKVRLILRKVTTLLKHESPGLLIVFHSGVVTGR